LDIKKCINTTILEEELENELKERKKKKLYLNVLYLRKVHGFCYYCVEDYEDEWSLISKCGCIHLRSSIIIGKRENINNYSKNYSK